MLDICDKSTVKYKCVEKKEEKNNVNYKKLSFKLFIKIKIRWNVKTLWLFYFLHFDPIFWNMYYNFFFVHKSDKNS